MIRKIHGIKKRYAESKSQQDYGYYLDSQAGMGTQVEDKDLEASFIEIFSPFAEDLFFYSNFSDNDRFNSRENDLNEHFSLDQKPQYGIVVHFHQIFLDSSSKEIFTSLRAFLIEYLARNRGQLIALKVIWEDCNDVTFKLPRNLSISEIEIAVTCFKNEYKKIISNTNSLNRTFVFNRKMGLFMED